MGEDGDLLVDNGEGGLSERQGDGGIGAMAARSGTVCDREQEPADASNSIAVCCSVLSFHCFQLRPLWRELNFGKRVNSCDWHSVIDVVVKTWSCHLWLSHLINCLFTGHVIIQPYSTVTVGITSGRLSLAWKIFKPCDLREIPPGAALSR